MPDLLPCPFCGFRDTEAPHPRLRECRDQGADPSFWIECDNCLCNGPMTGKGIDSRAEWNRRVPYLPPEDVETLRAVSDELRDGGGQPAWSANVLGKKLSTIIEKMKGDSK